MQHPDSPYFQFDRSSIGWLHRRQAGDVVLNADLIRIIDANPELIPDDLLRDYIVRGLGNKLKARRGRKAGSPFKARNFMILDLYEEILPYLQNAANRAKAEGRRKGRADCAPAERAYRLIGKRFGMEAESVRNIISSLKKQGF